MSPEREQQRRPVNTNATRIQCNAVATSSLPNDLSTSLTVNIMKVQKEEEDEEEGGEEGEEEEEGEDYLSTQKTKRHVDNIYHRSM